MITCLGFDFEVSHPQPLFRERLESLGMSPGVLRVAAVSWHTPLIMYAARCSHDGANILLWTLCSGKQFNRTNQHILWSLFLTFEQQKNQPLGCQVVCFIFPGLTSVARDRVDCAAAHLFQDFYLTTLCMSYHSHQVADAILYMALNCEGPQISAQDNKYGVVNATPRHFGGGLDAHVHHPCFICLGNYWSVSRQSTLQLWTSPTSSNNFAAVITSNRRA